MDSPLKRAFGAGSLFFLLMLCSCGEFDSIFPVNQTYQVSAITGNYSLDEYSGLRLHDEIQPFFIHPIKEDQDIRELVVSFQTPWGQPVGKKIRYSIGGDSGEEEDGEVLIRVAGTEEDLPPFRMNGDLEIGSYRMVFQILGKEGEIFSKTEKSVFYLADADYSISEIFAYLPGYSPGSYLIVPGTLVMLEAGVAADERLDPYVIWYDGKKRISEGKISEGGNRFFFKIPEENGFRLLRAEAFPFPPDKRSTAGDSGQEETAKGKIRELSLPVSVKGKGQEYFLLPEEEGENFNGHYLLAGDLRDSLDSRQERFLVREDEGGLSWLGYGGIYGLAVGPRDRYLIPQDIFGSPWQNQGKKIFNFRCKLLKDGPIFAVSLSNGSANFQLSRERENFVLTLEAGGNSKKVETVLPPTEDFIVFTVSLTFQEDALAVVLSPEGMPETAISVEFAGTLTGAAAYRLGSSVSGKTGEEKVSGEEEAFEFPALILDELAVTVREE
jgi:hypothetical protein